MYFKTLIQEQMLRSGKLAVGKEVPYLWDAPLDDAPGINFWQHISAVYKGQGQILSYFIGSTWDKRILALLIASAFFFLGAYEFPSFPQTCD